MRTAILAGLRAHVRRLIATGLAVMLGVGFVAGTLIFGDTARAALFDQFARAAKHVDKRVVMQTLPNALLWVWQGYRAPAVSRNP